MGPYVITVLMFAIWPSRKSFNPNQKANAKLTYIAKNSVARWVPVANDIRRPSLRASSTHVKCFLASEPSAHRENTVLMEPSASAAIVACFASA